MSRFRRLRHHLVPAAILIAAVWLVYGSCLGHDFLSNWDDQNYVTANEAIRGFSGEHLRQAFTSFFVGNYAPLQMLSYMLDYTLWGMHAPGFICTNILLHTLNGLFFYALLVRLGAGRSWATLSAGVFLLHPVQVEAVAWVSQRKTLLAMLFFLLAIHGHLSWRDRDGQGRRLYYAASLAAFSLALLAKIAAVILPAVLLLLDRCFPPRSGKDTGAIAFLPHLLVAGVGAGLAMLSQSAESGGGRVGYHGGSPLATLYTMLTVLVRYLRMICWPTALSAMYEPPIRTGIDAAVLLAVGLLALVLLGGVLLYRNSPRHFFWFALFFLALLPVAQIVPLITLMNDRYLYFPLLGAAALMGYLPAAALQAGRGRGAQAGAVAMLAFLPCLPFLAWQRTHVWRDALSLWSDTVQRVPGSAQAWFGLGDAYGAAGRTGEAVAAYRRALAINPLHPDALLNLGIHLFQRGEVTAAKDLLLRLVHLRPRSADAFFVLGNCYFRTGAWQEAERAYGRSLELEPESADALLNLGKLYAQEGKHPAARETFQRALRARGEHGEIYYNLATLDAVQGQTSEALRELELAFREGFQDVSDLPKNRALDRMRTLPEYRRLVQAHFPGEPR